MLRLLGILTLGNLLFGGRHHRRALGRGLLFGALLGYLANRDFDADRVAEDIREKARKAKRTARDEPLPVKWTVKQKTKREQEISGNQQRLPEFFFGECMANSTLLSAGQGLRKWPAATLDRLSSVC